MFADELLIKRERKSHDRNDEHVNDHVDRHLKRFGTGHPFSEIAQLRGESGTEQKNRDGGADEKIPKQQPVAAFKVGVRFCALVGRNSGEPGFGRFGRIKTLRRFSGVRRCRSFLGTNGRGKDQATKNRGRNNSEGHAL